MIKDKLSEEFVYFSIRAERINFYEKILNVFKNNKDSSLALMKVNMLIATKDYSSKEKDLIGMQAMLLERDFVSYGSILEDSIIGEKEKLIQEIENLTLELLNTNDSIGLMLLDLVNFNKDSLYEFMVNFNEALRECKELEKYGMSFTYIDTELIAQAMQNYLNAKINREDSRGEFGYGKRN